MKIGNNDVSISCDWCHSINLNSLLHTYISTYTKIFRNTLSVLFKLQEKKRKKRKYCKMFCQKYK